MLQSRTAVKPANREPHDLEEAGMSTGGLVAGVDCSTQAIKVVVVEPD